MKGKSLCLIRYRSTRNLNRLFAKFVLALQSILFALHDSEAEQLTKQFLEMHEYGVLKAISAKDVGEHRIFSKFI